MPIKATGRVSAPPELEAYNVINTVYAIISTPCLVSLKLFASPLSSG